MFPIENTRPASHSQLSRDCSKAIIGLIYLDRSTRCTDGNRNNQN